MIKDFLHLSITCRNIERSIRFYESLGLEVTKRFGDVMAPGIGAAFRLPSTHLKVVYLGVPKGHSKLFIDLVEWVSPAGQGDAYPVANNVGLNRFALRVENLDAMVETLKRNGVALLSDEPKEFGDGIRCIVATDPDGVFVQLIEGFN
jgi:glyoxylase I family protein